MAYGIYAKIYANAANPAKKQQPVNANDGTLPAIVGKRTMPASSSAGPMPRKFQHPDDIRARKLAAADKRREHDRSNVNIPVNRVYDARTNDVGWDHSRLTLSGNSAITWDRHSQKWVPSAYHAPVPVDRLVKMVSLPPKQRGNRQSGGSL